MAALIDIVQSVAAGLGIVVVGVLCLAGLALSCLSISGTWLVVAGSVLAAVVRWGRFPGFGTVLLFVAVAGVVEGIEAVSGTWGVVKRGGSVAAGFAAMVGGLIGLLVGGLIPVPIVGNILGMLAFSFGLVFLVERHRLKQSGQAANIAWGTVIGRLAMVLLKVTATLAMTAWLFVGLLR